MVKEQESRVLADKLLQAESSRLAVTAFTDELVLFTIEDAYQVQQHIVETKINGGQRVVGKKIGLTSYAMQKLLGVYEPDFGILLHGMDVPNGGTISLGELVQPKVEAEIAFLLNKDLQGPGVTVTDVLRATEAVAPALEIVDSRVKDWKIKIQDTVADNASSARFTLGNCLTPIGTLDLSLIGVVFKKNGEILSTAAGAAVLGHPAAAVAWLANKLSEFGVVLTAGEVVLSGAFSAAVTPVVGDYFEACFDRIGTVSVRFTE